VTDLWTTTDWLSLDGTYLGVPGQPGVTPPGGGIFEVSVSCTVKWLPGERGTASVALMDGFLTNAYAQADVDNLAGGDSASASLYWAGSTAGMPGGGLLVALKSTSGDHPFCDGSGGFTVASPLF
jgi:hypothetical protein